MEAERSAENRTAVAEIKSLATRLESAQAETKAVESSSANLRIILEGERRASLAAGARADAARVEADGVREAMRALSESTAVEKTAANEHRDRLRKSVARERQRGEELEAKLAALQKSKASLEKSLHANDKERRTLAAERIALEDDRDEARASAARLSREMERASLASSEELEAKKAALSDRIQSLEEALEAKDTALSEAAVQHAESEEAWKGEIRSSAERVSLWQSKANELKGCLVELSKKQEENAKLFEAAQSVRQEEEALLIVAPAGQTAGQTEPPVAARHFPEHFPSPVDGSPTRRGSSAPVPVPTSPADGLRPSRGASAPSRVSGDENEFFFAAAESSSPQRPSDDLMYSMARSSVPSPTERASDAVEYSMARSPRSPVTSPERRSSPGTGRRPTPFDSPVLSPARRKREVDDGFTFDVFGEMTPAAAARPPSPVRIKSPPPGREDDKRERSPRRGMGSDRSP